MNLEVDVEGSSCEQRKPPSISVAMTSAIYLAFFLGTVWNTHTCLLAQESTKLSSVRSLASTEMG